MRSIPARLFLALALLSSALSLAAQAAPRRFAILVGINQYVDPGLVPLSKAQNDAEELGAALKRLGGFKAVLVMSGGLPYSDVNFPTKSRIIERVEATAELMRPEDQLLFFFSGHGVNDRSGASYLLPIDARIKDPFGTGIELQRDLAAKLEAAGIRHQLYLIDACQKTVTKDKGIDVVGVNEIKRGGGAVVITATGRGKASYEDPRGPNGLFTRSLLAALAGEGDLDRDGSLSVAELEAYLPDAVAEYALEVGFSQKPAVFDGGSGPAQPPLAQLAAARTAAPAAAAPAGSALLPAAAAPTAKAQFVSFKVPEGLRIDLRLLSAEGRELRAWSDTASFSEKLEPGSYRIEAQDRSYLHYPFSASFTVGDAKLSLPIALKPNFGSLSLSCDPGEGVEVLLNGEKRGSLKGGALTLERLKSGSYELVLAKDLYDTRRQSILIEDGKTVQVKATLSPNFFTLTVSAAGGQPARLQVDGQDRGSLPLTLRLPYRNASLRVVPADPRYKEWSDTVRPSAKGAAEQRVASLAGRTGLLELTTVPDAEAAVSLTPTGGQALMIGTAPLDYEALIGDYEIRAEATVGGKKLVGGARLTIREGQTSPVRLELREVPTTPSIGSMVLVPAGSFLMGSPAIEAGRQENEGPQREVKLSAFLIGALEVTVGEFRDFVMATGARTQAEREGGGYVLTIAKNAGGYGPKADANWKNPYFEQGELDPVVLVSWYDCVDYCNWRSRREGLRLCYTISGQAVSCDFGANGYRLPTEAEWEYAAKGGPAAKRLAVQEVYAGSADMDGVAWNATNSGGKSHPVGGKNANALGLYDMAGNAREWCWDWNGSYSSGGQVNPIGPATGTHRVCRGGNWSSAVMTLRSAARMSNRPDGRDNQTGFRLVRRP